MFNFVFFIPMLFFFMTTNTNIKTNTITLVESTRVTNKFNSLLIQQPIHNIVKKDKTKMISISPGGFLGFYLLGISTFIKEKYNVDEYNFSGASAGAWNALFMCYKKDPQKLAIELIDAIEKNGKNIHNMEKIIKEILLDNYKEEDFDLSRLQIGITTLHIIPGLMIVSDFQTLEDAIDCCISSSHIPLVTGGLINKYRNKWVLDGGLMYPKFIKTVKPDLHITPSIWNDNYNYSLCDTIEQSKYFVQNKSNMFELFTKGYKDTEKNKHYLDSILGPSL